MKEHLNIAITVVVAIIFIPLGLTLFFWAH